MLHDSSFDASRPAISEIDRRSSDRLPYPGELVLRWYHDPETPVRHRIIDAGDGGVRIRSAVPLREGLTGVAERLLPEGRVLNRSVKVVWCASVHPDPLHDGPDSGPVYDAGLRFFSSAP